MLFFSNSLESPYGLLQRDGPWLLGAIVSIINKVLVELSLSNKIWCPHFCFPFRLKNFLHTKSFPKFCFKRIFISIFKIELNGSAPNIVTAAQPFSNRIIEILFCGIQCLTTLVELFSLDGGGTCQKCFSAFFWISGRTGSGKPDASILGESMGQE